MIFTNENSHVILAEGLWRLISKKNLQMDNGATELKHITKLIPSKLIFPVQMVQVIETISKNKLTIVKVIQGGVVDDGKLVQLWSWGIRISVLNYIKF